MQNILVDNAKVMADGQIALPQAVRDALGVRIGDQVTLVSQDNQVIMMNSAVYAMRILQDAMKGEAEKAGIAGPEDIARILRELRSIDRY